ncbi:MAG: hypothetical protein KC609_15335 [Myxococcales bacterium]|nr:hypothetical protein [Myxococcales bacterium]
MLRFDWRAPQALVVLLVLLACGSAMADNGGKLGEKDLKDKKACGSEPAPDNWEKMTPLTNPDYLYAFWREEAWIAECFNQVNYECGDAISDEETAELVSAVEQDIKALLYYEEEYLGGTVSETEKLEETMLSAARHVHDLLVKKNVDATLSYVCRHYAFALKSVLAGLHISGSIECGECPGSVFTSHAWIEVPGDDATYLLDAANQHYVRVTN